LVHYRLHYFPESGNSYKLALLLTLCGQTFEPVWTDFGSGITRTEEWRRRINPMGEIPVLEENGRSLTQTAPILLHLAEQFGRFGGRDEAERFEVLRWLFWDNHKLTGYMATYRFQRTFMPNPNTAVLAFLRGRLDDFLGILDRRVGVRPFVIGDQATIADLSMCAYLSFPSDETGYDFAVGHPNVHPDRAASRPCPGGGRHMNSCRASGSLASTVTRSKKGGSLPNPVIWDQGHTQTHHTQTAQFVDLKPDRGAHEH
jgi:glutathione S-transferase